MLVVLSESDTFSGTFVRQKLDGQKFDKLLTISEMFLSFYRFNNFFKTYNLLLLLKIKHIKGKYHTNW